MPQCELDVSGKFTLSKSNNNTQCFRTALLTGLMCRVQIMFNIDKAHFILDEMVTNGFIVETNKANVLRPIVLMDRSSSESMFKR